MANKIKVEKITFPERENRVMYLAEIHIGKEEIKAVLHQSELEKMYDQLRNVLGYNYSQNLKEDELNEIVDFQNKNRDLCFSCQFRMRECNRCVLVCESPLERKLFLELIKNGLNPSLQVWIAKNGNVYPRTSNFSPKDCLTRPDFYFENENHKICIYTDGFTYHNKSELKVGKDRDIDNKLQGFGYRVMRFTGKRIREDIKQVLSEIELALTA